MDGQTEERFVERGFRELIEAQEREAEAEPGGLRATHLGITRLVEPRALYREAVSLDEGTDPPVREVLRSLRRARTYLVGELSGSNGLEADLASSGIGWKVVPRTGHAMGLQNPEGFAETIADVVAEHWPH